MYAPGPADAFVDSIQSCNAWVGDRALRAYQAGILRGEGLEIASPVDGQSCRMEASCLLASDMMAYEFRGGQFYLVTGPQHEGYPLSFLLDATGPRLLHIDSGPGGAPYAEAPASERDRVLAALRRLQGQTSAEVRVHALFGDGNFAHLIWNGLGALAELERLDLELGDIQFISRCDPLGDPRRFFPALASMHLAGWDDLPQIRRGYKFRQATFLGARHVSRAIAETVLRVCDREAGEAVWVRRNGLIGHGGRTVWISLRRRRRDCTNQVEFIAELVDRLLRRWPVALIIDGFAYPDCPCPDFFHDYVQQVQEEFERLQARCPALHDALKCGRAMFLNGCSLYEAVSMASAADFYVCHGGTQQHKIAWLHPVPGVLHVPDPGPSVEAWYAAQSAVALPPRCIPHSMIRAEEAPDLEPRDRPYWIAVDEAVEFTLGAASGSLDAEASS